MDFDIAGWFNDTVIDPLVGWFSHMWGEILKGLYMLWATMGSVLDTIQIIYNMIVGTAEVVWQSTSSMGQGVLGEGASGASHNMVLDVFLSEYVLGALFKVIALSLFLLLIFTIIAIVKNEYSTPIDDSKKTAKGPIIRRAVRSLVGFLCVPLACIFGVIASGILMQALDGATSPTSSTVISNKLFAICAHDANRVRIDDKFYNSIYDPEGNNIQYDGDRYEDGKVNNDSKWWAALKIENKNDLAKFIDDLFIHGTDLPSDLEFNTGDKFANFYQNDDGINNDHFFNSKNTAQVFYYYDLVHFQWLVGFFSIIYIAMLLIKISLGAAGRLFELGILFVISPAILSLAPLDEGRAVGEWQKKFIGKLGMIYAPVVAINLYFILIGVLIQVDFASSITLAIKKGTGADVSVINTGVTAFFLQQIFNLFILIAGLQVCESAIGWLGQMIGAEDINEAGNKLGDKASKLIQTNAAAKFLLSKGKKMKSGALSAVGGAISAAKGDMKNRGLNTALGVNATASHNKQVDDIDSRLGAGSDAMQGLRNQEQSLKNSQSDAVSELGKAAAHINAGDAGKLDEYNAKYSEAMAALAGRTDLDDDTKAQMAAEKAREGISTGADEWNAYVGAANAKADIDKKLKEVQDKQTKMKADYDKEIADAQKQYMQQLADIKRSTRGKSRAELRAMRNAAGEEWQGMNADERKAARSDYLDNTGGVIKNTRPVKWVRNRKVGIRTFNTSRHHIDDIGFVSDMMNYYDAGAGKAAEEQAYLNREAKKKK